MAMPRRGRPPRRAPPPAGARAAGERVDGRPLGDAARVGRVVDGGPVAHGYADVGDHPAAVLAPEEQVAGYRGPADGAAVAHLSARRVGKRYAELAEDGHRKARAVHHLEGHAALHAAEHVWRAQVPLALGDHVSPGAAGPTAAYGRRTRRRAR